MRIFYEIGLRPGMTLEFHCALSSFGYVIGGAQTVIDALLEILGENGTLVVPMQRGDAEDPAGFVNPPVAYELQEKFRRNAPAFDPDASESYKMSDVYENLRRRKKAVVSRHPTIGFAAIGRQARYICASQPYDFPLGVNSPLEKLVSLKAFCLLAGVGYDSMTSLHYGESISSYRPAAINGASVLEEEKTVWKRYLVHDVDSDDGFNEIGERLESRGLVSVYEKGSLTLKLLRVDIANREAVSYYSERLKYYRNIK